MATTVWLGLLLTALHVRLGVCREVFDLSVDDIFSSMMNEHAAEYRNVSSAEDTRVARTDNTQQSSQGTRFLNKRPLLESRRLLMQMRKSFLDTTKRLNSTFLDGRRRLNSTATNGTFEEQIEPILELKDQDLKEIQRKLERIEFERIMNDTYNPLASFEAGVDEVDQLNKRFDALVRGPTRRGWAKDEKKKYNFNYYYDDHFIAKIQVKRFTIDTMQNVIYMARYRMPFSQLLRKRYVNDVKFKLGFCFALLRQLKLQQMYLYSAIKYKRFWYETLFTVVSVYERVLRINVDIRDLIKLIKNLDAYRKRVEFLDYYYYFPKSAGTAWRRVGDDVHTTTPMVRADNYH